MCLRLESSSANNHEALEEGSTGGFKGESHCQRLQGITWYVKD